MANNEFDYLELDTFKEVKWPTKLVEKFGKGKIFWSIILIVFVAGMVECAFIDYDVKHFKVEETSISYTGKKGNEYYYQDDEGNTIKYVEYSSDSFRVNDKMIYKDDIYTRISDREDITKYAYSVNGEVEVLDSLRLIMNGNGPYVPFERQLMAEFSRRVGKMGVYLYVNLMFSAVLLAFVSAGGFVFPKFFWELRHMLDTYGGEPSDFYLVSTRFVSGVIFVVALVMPVIGFYYGAKGL